MKINPVVSVIMPVYNNALYIEEAVQSILNQTFTDFELIIINDGSTDGTLELLKQFKDSRITLISKIENQGVSKATNEGFRMASGKYIARMDADDISVKERLEKQVKVMESNPEIIICGGLVQFLNGSNNNVIPYKEHHDDILAGFLLSCAICMGASMFHRDVLKGYFYDENKHSGEDYDFWTKVAWLGKMYNIQEVLLLYRVHDHQASKKHKSQQLWDDVDIRLSLFKKLPYNTALYTNELITKMLLLNKPISLTELVLFLNWLKVLKQLNFKSRVYPNKAFRDVMNKIKQNLLFTLFFKETTIGIDKKWRQKVLLRLSLKDIMYVLKIKTREVFKRQFKV